MADMNQLHLEDMGPVSSDDEMDTASSSPQKAGTTRAITEDGGLHKEVLAVGTGRDCPEPGDEVIGAAPLGGGPPPATVDIVGAIAKDRIPSRTAAAAGSRVKDDRQHRTMRLASGHLPTVSHRHPSREALSGRHVRENADCQRVPDAGRSIHGATPGCSPHPPSM
jgi:hypothetical protein